MAFVHQDSCECTKSELDLFSLPLTQTSIESGQWVHYHPIAPLSDGSNIEFVVPGSGEDYIDPAHTLLHLTVKVTNEAGLALAADVQVGPVNNWAHSMFSQIDVSLNQKLITSASHTYPYRAYIETVLGYDGPAKASHLTSRLFYKDTAGKMDDVENGNEGLVARRQFTAKSGKVDMITNLHCDLFNQEKYILNGVEMRIRLVRSKDEFHLIAKDGVKAKTSILAATLIVRKARLNPSVLIGHAKALEKASAKYNIVRADVKTITVNAGLRSRILDNIYLGQLPKRVIIGFVTNSAYNGSLHLNPFNFDHFGVQFLSLYVDGVQIPSQPLAPDYTHTLSPLYISAYHTLFSGTGIHFKDEGNDITRTQFPNGYCLYAFDLTPDLSSHSGHWNLQRNGCMRLEIRFRTELTAGVNCILYSEFDSLIEIDKHRNVQIDYVN